MIGLVCTKSASARANTVVITNILLQRRRRAPRPGDRLGISHNKCGNCKQLTDQIHKIRGLRLFDHAANKIVQENGQSGFLRVVSQ
jgi:D-serine deaminase-like pyridoxal phosphate-dependent protein